MATFDIAQLAQAGAQRIDSRLVFSGSAGGQPHHAQRRLLRGRNAARGNHAQHGCGQNLSTLGHAVLPAAAGYRWQGCHAGASNRSS